jgi:hypothetical protein
MASMAAGATHHKDELWLYLDRLLRAAVGIGRSAVVGVHARTDWRMRSWRAAAISCGYNPPRTGAARRQASCSI